MLAFVVAEGSGSLQILFNVPSTTFFLVATFMTLVFWLDPSWEAGDDVTHLVGRSRCTTNLGFLL